MVGLRAKVLGRLGRSENALTKSVCFILPIARRLRAGVSRTSHPALRFSFALRQPWLRPVLRRIVGGETMTTPGGPSTLRKVSFPRAPPPVSLIRSELSLYGGSDPLSGPPRFASHRSG